MTKTELIEKYETMINDYIRVRTFWISARHSATDIAYKEYCADMENNVQKQINIFKQFIEDLKNLEN